MTLDRKLLDIICCPVTHLPLQILASSELAQLNRLIGDGDIKTRDDTTVSEPLEEALVTDDGKLVYPVRDGIPVLLEECAIHMAQLSGR